jgi:hypothetical protein
LTACCHCKSCISRFGKCAVRVCSASHVAHSTLLYYYSFRINKLTIQHILFVCLFSFINLSTLTHSSSSSLYTHIYKVMMRCLCCVRRDPLYHSYPPSPLPSPYFILFPKDPRSCQIELILYLPYQSVKCQSLSCQSATTCWIPLLALV